MASQEIADGLRAAMNKGESLMQAMMSFYNAGYSKQDVEDAARMINQLPEQQMQMQAQPQQPTLQTTSQTQTQSTPPQKQFPQGQPIQRISAYGQPQQPQAQQTTSQPQVQTQFPQQQVSAYGQQQKTQEKPKSMITIVLIIMLIILVALLASLFIFRSVITDFFSGLLGRVLFNFL